MVEWHSVSEKDSIQQLGSDSANGLNDEEASKRLSTHGFNEIERAKKRRKLAIFLEQFNNILILLLIGAAIIAAIMGEFLDAAAMLSIVILAALFGFVQEYRAEEAIEALRKMSSPSSIVIRNGKEKQIPSRELVPGDIILLEIGNIVPADCRFLGGSNLEADEASLTGESIASKKNTGTLGFDVSINDRKNMLFAGTVITYGRGVALVVETGTSTEFGKIAEFIKKEPDSKTPLQIKFEKIAQQIGLIVLILVAIVFAAGVLGGNLSIQKMLLFSLSLAVAAVPNSLPAIVTISLALGAQQMAKRRMIIRKLPATESLGAVTVICSDKTGTITKNEMTVTKVFTNSEEFFVSGAGYNPEGIFTDSNGKKIGAEKFELLSKICVMCNDAVLESDNGHWKIIGDPTEGALMVLGSKAFVTQRKVFEELDRFFELPFDSERKMMSVIARDKKNGVQSVFVKGAPEFLLAKCNRIIVNGKIRALSAADREKILGKNLGFSDEALRVIGLAFNDNAPKNPVVENTEKDLIFVGLAAMIDPPREEVFDAMEKAKAAGIKVMMITGDSVGTATAVAKKIGLYKEGDLVLTGFEIDRMSDMELESKIDLVSVIARTMPIQKSRIISALKKNGHIVCMTGDGVNDAPALKKADLGISMGLTGTDVAKEVSEAMITDDNFATIIEGVMEGRNVYDKIINSTRYLLSCNAGEITIVVISILFGMPLPLIPLQILLMNLLTDGLPALGLGFEKSTQSVMNRPPIDPREKPLSNRLVANIIVFGLIMGTGSFLLFQHYLPDGIEKAQTIAFTTLVMFQMFAAIGSRTTEPFKSLNLLSNKWLLGGIASSVLVHLTIVYWGPAQIIFGTVPLGLMDWARILLMSSLGFVLMEAGKFFLLKKNGNKKPFSLSNAPA